MHIQTYNTLCRYKALCVCALPLWFVVVDTRAHTIRSMCIENKTFDYLLFIICPRIRYGGKIKEYLKCINLNLDLAGTIQYTSILWLNHGSVLRFAAGLGRDDDAPATSRCLNVQLLYFNAIKFMDEVMGILSSIHVNCVAPGASTIVYNLLIGDYNLILHGYHWRLTNLYWCTSIATINSASINKIDSLGEAAWFVGEKWTFRRASAYSRWLDRRTLHILHKLQSVMLVRNKTCLIDSLWYFVSELVSVTETHWRQMSKW